MEREAHLRTARDCLQDDVRSLPLDLPLADAVHHLLTHGAGAAPVVDADGKVCGMLSEQDLIRDLAAANYDTYPSGTVADSMHKGVLTVTPGTDLFRLAVIFAQTHFRQLPVVDERGHLLGMVSRGDLLRALDTVRREREQARHPTTYETLERHRRQPG